MALLRTDFAEVIPDLKKDEGRIKETLEALSLREGERYVSLGIGTNLLPLIIAMQGVIVTGVDISFDALAYQTLVAKRYAEESRQASGIFQVYNFNFDDPHGTKPQYGFPTLDPAHFHGFDVVECVYFNHREGEDDLAQILLNAASPSARFFVSAPGGAPPGIKDRIASALMKWNSYLHPDRPKLEVAATNLYVSTCHSNNYGVVLKPNSHL